MDKFSSSRLNMLVVSICSIIYLLLDQCICSNTNSTSIEAIGDVKSSESLINKISKFHDAVKSGNIPTVLLLLSDGVDVNVLGSWSKSPLHMAAEAQNFEMVELLVKHGALINAQCSSKWTCLHWAARYGNVKIASFALEKGALVDVTDSYQTPPLNYAIQYGHLQIVAMLIKHGANVNVIDDGSHNSLLMLAVKHRQLEIVMFLVEMGINLNNGDERKATFLGSAVLNDDLEMAMLLVKNGASIGNMYDSGWPPLRLAVEYGRGSMVSLLLRHGARTDIVVDENKTLLQLAINYRRSETARMLMRASNADLRDEPLLNWANGLHRAAYDGSMELIVQLLEIPAICINQLDGTGSTALHWAVYNNHISVAELLIARGANVAAQDFENQTPFHIAAQQGHAAMIDMLQDERDTGSLDKYNLSALNFAAMHGHFNVVWLLLEGNMKWTNKSDYHLLHLMTWCGHEEIVCRLVDRHVCIKRPSDSTRPSLLHLATVMGHVMLVEVLERRGADMREIDWNGRSLLHLAAIHGHISVAQVLVNHGVEVNMRDYFDRTPLCYAMLSKRDDIVKLLLPSVAQIDTCSLASMELTEK